MTKVRLSENVVFRSFGSETVLLNLTTGHYHGVKGSGGRMLEALVETGDVEKAVEQIAIEYDEPRERISDDMRELCAALVERSLIELDPHDRAESGDGG